MTSWTGGRMILLALAMLATVLGSTYSHGEDKQELVRVVIDYNDGSERHFTRIAWQDGMTVLDAMQAVKAHPRGITFQYKGRGATAFLTELDKVKNEGRGRNWLFSVNGKRADRSFGVLKLKAGDAVLWKFDKYR